MIEHTSISRGEIRPRSSARVARLLTRQIVPVVNGHLSHVIVSLRPLTLDLSVTVRLTLLETLNLPAAGHGLTGGHSRGWAPCYFDSPLLIISGSPYSQKRNYIYKCHFISILHPRWKGGNGVLFLCITGCLLRRRRPTLLQLPPAVERLSAIYNFQCTESYAYILINVVKVS